MADAFVPSELELAWAAGFFDGEGSVYLKDGKYAVIGITQIHPYVLERFVEAVGIEKSVDGPYKKRNRANVVWELRYGRVSEVEAIYKLLKPYLSPVKQTQFETTLRNAKVPNRYRSLSPTEKAEIRDLHRSGVSQRAIARQYGASTTSISAVVHG